MRCSHIRSTWTLCWRRSVISGKRSAKVRTLSGGQRRRLDLALGLVGDPEVLFLDEPTVGFDPAARRQAWSLIERLKAQGTTVLLTTHYLDEAERLADRVGILVAGRLVALGTPSELAAGREGATVSFRLPAGKVIEDLPRPRRRTRCRRGRVAPRHEASVDRRA